jgi:hypothetical protein
MINNADVIVVKSANEFHELNLSIKDLIPCHQAYFSEIAREHLAMNPAVVIDCLGMKELLDQGLLDSDPMLLAIINHASEYADQLFANAQTLYLANNLLEAKATSLNASNWQALSNSAVMALKRTAPEDSSIT